jgi:hypothetical protein
VLKVRYFVCVFTSRRLLVVGARDGGGAYV